MTDRRILKPSEGCTVHDPITYEALPADGKTVEMDSYWHRRLTDGDVVEVKQADAGQKKTAGDK